MNSDSVVCVVVLTFWTMWFAGAVYTKRSWIPIIPIVPFAFVLVGLGLNWLGSGAGAAVVVTGHVAVVFLQLRGREL
jgi:hypothetical protein